MLFNYPVSFGTTAREQLQDAREEIKNIQETIITLVAQRDKAMDDAAYFEKEKEEWRNRAKYFFEEYCSWRDKYKELLEKP